MMDVGRWLPIQVDPTSLEDSLGNKILYPQTVPVSRQDLYLEQALFVEELRKNPQDWVKDGKIVIPPKLLTISKTLGEAMLTVLNALEPKGIVEVEGAGVVIAPEGITDKEKVIAEITIDFGLTQKQQLKVLYDSITVIPQTPDTKATLTIKLQKPFKINGKDKVKIVVEAGKLGIVFDARGRPLSVPQADATGRARMQKWQKALESNWSADEQNK